MRPLLLRAGLALVLGAVVTLAIAWGLALSPDRKTWSQMGFHLSPSPPHRPVTIETQFSRGYEWMQFSITQFEQGTIFPAWQSLGPQPTGDAWRLRESDTRTIRGHLERIRRPMREELERPPMFSWPTGLPPIPGQDLLSYGGRATGWPLLCMRSFATLRTPGEPLTWRWSLRLFPVNDYPLRNTRDPQAGCIPLRPIVLPFLANTLLFAAPFLVLLLAPPLLRKRLRRRRGHCPRCNYDLRASPDGCPECGAGRGKGVGP